MLNTGVILSSWSITYLCEQDITQLFGCRVSALISQSWLPQTALGASASILVRAFQLQFYILPFSFPAALHTSCCDSDFQSLCGTIFPVCSCCSSHHFCSHDVTLLNTLLPQQVLTGSSCLWCEIHLSFSSFFLLFACGFWFILSDLIICIYKLKNQPAMQHSL